MKEDKSYLYQALQLAKIRRGFCAPNPSVGAVVVKDNVVLAEGYHHAAGKPHAEVEALSKLTAEEKKGATIYVTLEPCCHFGRTPPCTHALIEARLSRVIYGYRDPNALVAGKGEAELKAAGISCEHIKLPEIHDFYQSYAYWQMTKKPFVTAKIAMSLDGKAPSVRITGDELAEYTHQCRKNADAIFTTAKTILVDDPQMNVRLKGEIIAKPVYILDRQGQLSENVKIFQTAKSITLFHSNKISLDKKNIRLIAVNENENGLDLSEIINHIGQDGIHDLWIEAGKICFDAFLREKLLQRAFIYLTPSFSNENFKRIGNDVLCEICW